MSNEIDWYERRDELKCGDIFTTRDGSVVMLDGTVPGDGTKWRVLDWFNGWSDEGGTIEPGDLCERADLSYPGIARTA